MKDHLIRSINAIQLYSSIIIKLELTFLSINKEMCSLQYCPQFLNSLNYLSRKLSKTAFNQSQYKIKNMSQQIQQHYKINMKDSIQNTSTDIKIIINKLKSRWAFENIFKERNIVTNMNCKLEVTLKCLKKCDLLKTVGDRQIASIIGNIPFLQRVEGQGGQSKVPTWRFCYSYPQSVLIVTGICSLSLKQQLQKYAQLSSKHHKGDDKRKKAVVTILHEGFFTMIDAETKENAQLLKGFLRTNKKYLQERRRADFKQDNRRIRIMRFHEEDLFSFIIDIMTEYKAQIFTKSMDQDLSLTMKQRCQPRVRKTDQIFYKPFSIRSLQNNAYFWSSSQPQERQQEVEDQNSEDYQEFYSITSLNSQVDESKNLDFGQVIDKFSQSTSLSYQQLIESEESNNE